jgi:cob(I)alamin adenosyltransferase
MKIYTRTGDDGTTGLIGGGRVRKSDARLECTGTIDELNAALGMAAVALEGGAIFDLVRQVQNDLFVLGSHLSAPDPGASHRSSLPMLDEQLVTHLEMQIDAAEHDLPPLQNFILPGGTEAAARLHLARTICRRGERLLADFSMDRPVPAMIQTYLNRLSDWLFVHARLANHQAGVEDVIWKKEEA